MAYFNTENAVFNEQLKKLEATDPAHADTFNAGMEQLIWNDIVLKKMLETMSGNLHGEYTIVQLCAGTATTLTLGEDYNVGDTLRFECLTTDTDKVEITYEIIDSGGMGMVTIAPTCSESSTNDVVVVSNMISFTVNEYVTVYRIDGKIMVDLELSEESTNPVQNKVVAKKFSQLSQEKVDYTDLENAVATEVQEVVDSGELNPEKGVDYWTDGDKAELVQEVIDALGGDVVGGVKADNSIVLVGELANGTYPTYYQHADGTLEEIGTFTVTDSYDPEITYVNILNTAMLHTDLTTIFNSTGYMDGVRASSSSPFYSTASGYVTTGCFAVDFDTVLYIKGVTIDTSDSNVRFGFGKTVNTSVFSAYAVTSGSISTHTTLETLADNYYKVTFNSSYLQTNCPDLAWFFFSAVGSGADLIVSTTPIE